MWQSRARIGLRFLSLSASRDGRAAAARVNHLLMECVLKALCSRVGKNTHTDDIVQSFINSLVHKFFFVTECLMIGRQSWPYASPYKPLVIYMKDPKK